MGGEDETALFYGRGNVNKIFGNVGEGERDETLLIREHSLGDMALLLGLMVQPIQ